MSEKRKDYITWDEYFMGVAILSGHRSKDPNTQVGACIVSEDNKILSMGYNGFPMGCSDDEFPWNRDDEDPYCNKYFYSTHSELNAILNYRGGSLEGALYGDALALAAAFFVGAYTLIGRVQRASLSTNTYTFVVYSFCLLTLLVMDFATGTPVVGLPLREFLPPLALAVFSTLLGHSLFSYCLKYFPPAYVSAVKLAEPVIAAIVAVPCFGEWPTAATVAGGALILLSLLFYTRQEAAR